MDINALKRVMKTIDGRDFIYNFFLESCGVDLALGIPSKLKDDYNQGVIKPAIDIYNLLVYNCYDEYKIMLREQIKGDTNE